MLKILINALNFNDKEMIMITGFIKILASTLSVFCIVPVCGLYDYNCKSGNKVNNYELF